MRALLILLGLVALGAADRKTYEGYRLVDTIPTSLSQIELLRDVMLHDANTDFWEEPSRLNKNVRLLVPGDHFDSFVAPRLETLGLPYTFKESNMKRAMAEFWETIDSRPSTRAFDLNDWNTLADVYLWLDEIVQNCPVGIVCQVVNLGNTFEGREMRMLKLSKPGINRKAYWIDSMIHAREWLALATHLKIINELVYGYGINPESTELLDNFDWHLIPVVNPDGYAFTWSDDRLWRKNRHHESGKVCIGVDLNRNFNFRWGLEGVSHNQCSDLFCGNSGGSELETQHQEAEMARVGSTLNGLLTMHSYGDMWMFPWGNTVDYTGTANSPCERTADFAELNAVSNQVCAAIDATHNTVWSCGTSCEVIYETTGATDDYAKGVPGIKYPFTCELRGNGFVVSTAQIQPSFEEMWNGVVAMTRAIP